MPETESEQAGFLSSAYLAGMTEGFRQANEAARRRRDEK